MNRKILIVDDHPAIRLAVQVLFEKNGDDIVGEAATGIDALALARTLSPDLIILDFLMPELDGLTVIERLLSTQTTTRILVFSQQTPSHLALRSMLVGAHGYLSKENPLTDLLQAADQIMAGQRYFPDIPETLLNSSLQDESALIKTLSPREFMVLLCLVEGQSNNDISKRMLLSNKTISTYKTRLLNKLNANSLVHLIELAQRHHLV